MKDSLLKDHPTAFLVLGEMYDLQELKDVAELVLLSQLMKENMVEMISMGEFYRAVTGSFKDHKGQRELAAYSGETVR